MRNQIVLAEKRLEILQFLGENIMNRRVVITGLGVISSIGIGKDEFWKNIISGRSGISPVETFSTDGYEMHRGGEIKNFVPEKFIPRRKLKDIARASQFAVAATKLALEDAKIENAILSKTGAAVIMGTTMSEAGMIEEIDKHWMSRGEADVWGLTISKYPSNAISDNVNRMLKLKGMSCLIPTACSAGNYSIGYGFDRIRSGSTEYAIVGGSDPFSRIGFTGFGRLYAMSPDMCRPFDKNRKGMMLGEGSGVLILEGLNSARERGAHIYAEILGYGLSCDADNMTIPSVEGISKVMKKAIKNSGIQKEDVDYICAHGTGTPSNDKAETDAVKNVFGLLVKNIPVSSIKSMLGHTMGAASAIEAISCCMAIENDIIPPTINFETPDPECDLDYVPNKAREKTVNIALNNSLAFGGNNACLVIRKYK